MLEYLAERYEPGATREQVEADASRLAAAAGKLHAGGHLIEFVGVIQTAAASPPTDLTPLGPLLPSCSSGAPDTHGAHICWVVPLRPSWQASTGEWIVVRIGDSEPVDPANPGAAQSLCEQ